jgi:hypothetical protein
MKLSRAIACAAAFTVSTVIVVPAAVAQQVAQPEPTQAPLPIPPPVPQSQPQPPPDLHLACHGIASFTERSSGSAFVFNRRGDSASGFVGENHRGEAEGDVYFDLLASGARIKLPGIMVPPIHTGDDHGWRPIHDLQVTDTEIIGRFEVNFINKPTLSINRVTGHIDLKGFSKMGFSGDCKPYEASARMF